jgi:release factor glutamine methyltransferase
MTVGLFIEKAIAKLKDSSIPTARLDVEVIVSHYLGVDRSWLQAHSEDELPKNKEVEMLKKIERRTKNEPVAYILGYKEFYGRNFIVNKNVLVPRPESEAFIEILGSLSKIKTILDIGTGSGCLAITANLQFPSLDVFATDISKQALEIATANAKNLNASIEFKLQNMLDSDENDYDVIMANLPYVPDSMNNKSIMREPKIALFSGVDGLDHYRNLLVQIEKKPVHYIMTESLLEQHEAVKNIAKLANYDLCKTDGLVQLFTRISS